MRVAIVVTRYGRDIGGGAETEAWAFAERLAARGHDVTVLCTCVRDFATWRNDVPAGVSNENGVRVERFPSLPRDHGLIARLQPVIDAGLQLPDHLQRAWARSRGESPALLTRIDEIVDSVDVLLFVTYLFASSVLGAVRNPQKSVLMPHLHDEPYARFASTGELLRGVSGLVFNTAAERELAERLWGPLPPSAVVGSGFDVRDGPDAAPWRKRRGVGGDVVVYAGRRDVGKNFSFLVQAVTAYNLAWAQDRPLTLVTMGRGEVQLPPSARPFVRHLGFVSEEEKLAWLGAAVAVTNLSLTESLSLLLMEGWSVGTPGIVHERCPVTRQACEESGGGLWIGSVEEFAAALDHLRRDPALRRRLGDAGRRWVAERYSWNAVMERLEDALRSLVRVAA